MARQRRAAAAPVQRAPPARRAQAAPARRAGRPAVRGRRRRRARRGLGGCTAGAGARGAHGRRRGWRRDGTEAWRSRRSGGASMGGRGGGAGGRGGSWREAERAAEAARVDAADRGRHRFWHLHSVQGREHQRDRERAAQGGRGDERRSRDQGGNDLPAHGPRRRGEVPDLRLGRGRLLEERVIERDGDGRDRLAWILRRRGRHAEWHAAIAPRTVRCSRAMAAPLSPTSTGRSPRTANRAAPTTRASTPGRSPRTGSRAAD